MHLAILQGLAILATALTATSAIAQADSLGESRNRVAVHTDWSVFEESSPTKHCWSVAQPKETVNTRDGRIVSVRRGRILLYISFIPDENVNGGVSFESGYPLRDGEIVKVDIDSQSFSLPLTVGELAWTNSDEDDSKLVEALKRGKEAVVIGVSSRGTTTKDTFSLIGITAAIEDARNRCGG